VIRTWWKLVSFALVAALAVPSLVGQAKLPLTPAGLTLKKSMGSPAAPIKLEIFSDYQCPACREMHLSTTLQVIDNYVSSGKVYLVHHDYPLSMHPYSRVAARWVNAAAAVGSFQAAENALYTKQDQWGATGNVEQALAASLPAAEMTKIRAMELSQRAQLDAIVQADVTVGNSRNITGTPSIFVVHRGQTIPLPSGPVPYPLLKQYLDSLLAQH
jgi:protein-disulfide isomerase